MQIYHRIKSLKSHCLAIHRCAPWVCVPPLDDRFSTQNSKFRLAAVVLLVPALRWPLARRPSCCCLSVCSSQKLYPLLSSLNHTSCSLSFASLLPSASTSTYTSYFIARWRGRSRSATRIHLHIRIPAVRRALCSVTSHWLKQPALGRARVSHGSHSKNTAAVALLLLVTQFLSFQTWKYFVFAAEYKLEIAYKSIHINCWEFGTLEKIKWIINHVSLKLQLLAPIALNGLNQLVWWSSNIAFCLKFKISLFTHIDLHKWLLSKRKLKFVR